MFHVINGNKKEKEEKLKSIREKKISLYKENFHSNLYSFKEDSSSIKAILFGVKYIARTSPRAFETYEDSLRYFLDIKDIKTLMASLTYKEFINLFPIIKDYSGKKFQCKDYFSVKDYLKDFDLDEEITLERLDELLWNYYNNDIMFFVVNEMAIVDVISVYNGGKTILDTFLDEFDKEHKIHTYTYHEKEGYMYDRVTGKTFKVTKPKKRNRNFKIVK